MIRRAVHEKNGHVGKSNQSDVEMGKMRMGLEGPTGIVGPETGSHSRTGRDFIHEHLEGGSGFLLRNVVPTYQTTLCHNRRSQYSHHSENVRSYLRFVLFAGAFLTGMPIGTFRPTSECSSNSFACLPGQCKWFDVDSRNVLSSQYVPLRTQVAVQFN